MKNEILNQITNKNRLIMEEIELNKPKFKGKSKYKSVIIRGNSVSLAIKRLARKLKSFKEPEWVAEVEIENKLIAIKRRIINGLIYETYSLRPDEWRLYYKKRILADVSGTCFLVKWYARIWDDKTEYGFYDTEEEAKTIIEKNLRLAQ